MKKIFTIIFFSLFLFSCSSKQEINNLKKEVSELKEIIKNQQEYNNNIFCSISVNSFLSARNTHFNNIITTAEDFFYSKKENKCIALIKFLEKYYIYEFGKIGFDNPNIFSMNYEEAVEKISEYRKNNE